MKDHITCLIIDDEEDGRQTLKLFLESYCPEVKVIEMADGKKSGIAAIRRHNPDLVFLDIEMPGGGGFELLSELNGRDFDLIFVTAYDEFALRAFKVNAADYLLKPLNPEELIEAVEKACQRIRNHVRQHFLESLLGNIETMRRNDEKVSFPEGKGLKFVLKRDVVHCRSESNYTHIHLKTGQKLFLAKTIKWVGLRLADDRFFRIHASHLINLQEIVEYGRTDGGYVVMSDGSRLPIAASKRPEFLRRMDI